MRVCLACGKVQGEHRGWDVSCEIHAYLVREGDVLTRGDDGRVTRIDNPGIVASSLELPEPEETAHA